MTKKTAILAMAIVLSGCGANPNINSDKPFGPYLIAEEIKQSQSVQVLALGPSLVEGGTTLKAASCRNRIWQPEPTQEAALNQLKLEAEKQGLDAIHSVSYRKEGTSLIANCWSTIYATGIGFKSSEFAPEPTVQ